MSGDAVSQLDSRFVAVGGSVPKESQSQREVGRFQLAVSEGGDDDLTGEIELQVISDIVLPNRGADSATVERDMLPDILPVISFRESVRISSSGHISMTFVVFSAFPLYL